MSDKCCCFIGHRKINRTEELSERLYRIIEKLISEKNVDTFLFGSKSQFNDLCYDTVTKLKEKHPYIKRIYVRAEYPYINDDYKEYLLKIYEDTYFPEKAIRAGRAVYTERNCEMIDNSRFCVIYYAENEPITKRKSGTKNALDYAQRRNKEIIMTYC